MPVYRPTADCIWNSFRSSGKRHLILTGGRGAGKTTLLASLFPQGAPGLTTWAQKGQGVYLKDNGTGSVCQVGVFDPGLPGEENKMRPVLRGFETLGVQVLAHCRKAPEQWVTIDEIGYLETRCPVYCAGIVDLMERKHLAAVVRKQELPFLRELCGRPDVFLVDLDAPYGNQGCVIMASGLGQRFGGNKLLATFRGEPMLLRTLAATEGIFRNRVVVTRDGAAAALCRERGIETVLHARPYRSDTVRLGLEAVGAVRQCLFCPADQPLLRQQTVATLALAGTAVPDGIWRPCSEQTPGAPVLFPQWSFSELRQLSQSQGGGAVIRRYPEFLHTIPADKWELRDVDTPEALAQLEEVYSAAFS